MIDALEKGLPARQVRMVLGAVSSIAGRRLNMSRQCRFQDFRMVSAEPSNDLAALEWLIELVGALRQQGPHTHSYQCEPNAVVAASISHSGRDVKGSSRVQEDLRTPHPRTGAYDIDLHAALRVEVISHGQQ